jgi:tetratricopeptide (TPR) repeat protein
VSSGRRPIRLALIAAIALACLPCFTDAAATADDSPLKRLRDCVERADRACARTVLAKSLDSRLQDSPEYLEFEARAFDLLRQKPEALDAIQRALQKDPKRYSFRMTEGRIYQSFNDQESAIRDFLLADRLQPRSPDTFYALGMSFFLLNEYERSQKHFLEALELDRRYARAEFMLGVIEMVRFRLSEAKSPFEKALALQPRNPFYHLHYGILLGRLGDNATALREVLVAKSLDPSYALTRFNLGRLYKETGDYRAARTELEQAVRLRPGLSAAYYQLGSVYHHLGMDDASRKAYREFARATAEERREALDPIESTLVPSKSEGGPGTP